MSKNYFKLKKSTISTSYYYAYQNSYLFCRWLHNCYTLIINIMCPILSPVETVYILTTFPLLTLLTLLDSMLTSRTILSLLLAYCLFTRRRYQCAGCLSLIKYNIPNFCLLVSIMYC